MDSEGLRAIARNAAMLPQARAVGELLRIPNMPDPLRPTGDHAGPTAGVGPKSGTGNEAVETPLRLLQDDEPPGLRTTTPLGDRVIISPLSLDVLGAEEELD